MYNLAHALSICNFPVCVLCFQFYLMFVCLTYTLSIIVGPHQPFGCLNFKPTLLIKVCMFSHSFSFNMSFFVARPSTLMVEFWSVPYPLI